MLQELIFSQPKTSDHLGFLPVSKIPMRYIFPANLNIPIRTTIFIAQDSNTCHKETSTKIMRAGITIKEANGNNDAICANPLCAFDSIPSAIKNGIIINISSGQTPDCASCGLSNIAPTVA